MPFRSGRRDGSSSPLDTSFSANRPGCGSSNAFIREIAEDIVQGIGVAARRRCKGHYIVRSGGDMVGNAKRAYDMDTPRGAKIAQSFEIGTFFCGHAVRLRLSVFARF